jgi:uncharacterized membrane protein
VNRIEIARGATLTGYFALLSLVILWIIWLSPPQRLPMVLVLITAVAPLLCPLEGILKRRPYTHAWTSLLSLAYVAHGIVETYSNPHDRYLAIIEILSATTLYLGAAFYARYRSRELKVAGQH